MSPQKKKALQGLAESYLKHKGHTLSYPSTQVTCSFTLADALVINDTVMLRAEGEPFATHHTETPYVCSCGEGK